MSRSYQKTAITGITKAASDKQGKRFANRKLRSKVKEALGELTYEVDEDVIFPEMREVSDVWSFDKDGKMSFDPKEQPKLMRK